jgi:hypothetical protein
MYQGDRWQQEQMQHLDDESDAGDSGDQYGDSDQYGDAGQYEDQYGDSGQYGQYGDQYGDSSQYGDQYGDSGQYGDDGGQYGDQYGSSGTDDSGGSGDVGPGAGDSDTTCYQAICEHHPGGPTRGTWRGPKRTSLDEAQADSDAHNQSEHGGKEFATASTCV